MQKHRCMPSQPVTYRKGDYIYKTECGPIEQNRTIGRKRNTGVAERRFKNITLATRHPSKHREKRNTFNALGLCCYYKWLRYYLIVCIVRFSLHIPFRGCAHFELISNKPYGNSVRKVFLGSLLHV